MNLKKLNGKELRGALIGMMLGDMSAFIRKDCKNGIFSITHSVKQLEYLEFKTELIKNNLLVGTHISERNTNLNGKIFKQYQMCTNVSKHATYMRRFMYKCGVKHIKNSILKQLTDFGLYLWYLDDGYLNIRYDKNTGKVKEYRIFIYTNSFKLDEQILIQKWFAERYNISPNINKKSNGHILYFNSSKTRELMKILNPFSHLVACMEYKFLGYHNLL